MKSIKLATLVAAAAAALLMGAQPEGRGRDQPAQPTQEQQPAQSDPQQFRFRTGIELINVTATVTDETGRFVPGLRKEDFRVYQDDQPQPITHFNAERVPVSLGIVLDTSGSMDGEKMLAAREALGRFLDQLIDRDDEVFLYRFDTVPVLIASWTGDKGRLTDQLRRIQPRGGTAMYDALTEAVPLAQAGHNRKKALVIISDGNDTSSVRTDAFSVKRLIRETEVIVYAIGIDTQSDGFFGPPPTRVYQRRPQPPRLPTPFPFPFPGSRRPPPPRTPPTYPPSVPRGGTRGGDDRVNVAALRDITDDSGGRTEIIRSPGDLEPATAGIADELSRQYYLGYSATGVKDGKWHTIRVELRNPSYHVRARRGFVATP
ncbi:MAG: VWA domain-containing protein [Acidobacteriota bacterium]